MGGGVASGQFGSLGKTWIRVKDQKERKTEQRLSRQTTTISIPPTCRMSEPTTNTTGDYKDNNSHVWFKLHFYSWSTSSPSTAEVPRSLSTREARIQVRKYICEPVHTTHLRAKAVWLPALKIVIVMGGSGGFSVGKVLAARPGGGYTRIWFLECCRGLDGHLEIDSAEFAGYYEVLGCIIQFWNRHERI